MNNKQKTDLELLMDTCSPSIILKELVNICDEKANHLRENWQDSATAKQWEKVAGIILTAASKVDQYCPQF